jgi:hypothetical protein
VKPHRHLASVLSGFLAAERISKCWGSRGRTRTYLILRSFEIHHITGWKVKLSSHKASISNGKQRIVSSGAFSGGSRGNMRVVCVPLPPGNRLRESHRNTQPHLRPGRAVLRTAYRQNALRSERTSGRRFGDARFFSHRSRRNNSLSALRTVLRVSFSAPDRSPACT